MNRLETHLYTEIVWLIGRPLASMIHEITGYWCLDRTLNWPVPAALARFIESGPAPIYVGFGSMMMKNPTAIVTAVLDAVRRTADNRDVHH
jgi:sterol 3beta-glucosyltransferase